MKTVLKITLALWLLSLPIFVLAQSARELHADANAQDVASDRKLNAAYGRLIKSIRATHDKARAELVVERLRESQRAWLKFREAQLAFVGTFHDIGSPSARAAGISTYNSELVEARIKDLNEVPDPF